jgi:hypothetical protein
VIGIGGRIKLLPGEVLSTTRWLRQEVIRQLAGIVAIRNGPLIKK